MSETGRVVAGEGKKILGLVGSPRKLGNCEVIIKEISQHLAEGYALELIRMPSLDIRPCSACYRCIMDSECPNDDDMGFLLDRIAGADALIIASPVYFLGAHSIFKRVLDRGFLLYRVLEKTYGKPCLLLSLYGMDDRIGVAPHTLMTFASFLGLEIRAVESLKAALPGEVLMDKRTAIRARSLARRLLPDSRPAKGRGCPFCGCPIVRMERSNFVCTLCHGTFTLDKGGNAVRMASGGIFGTPGHMLRHKDWLSAMKEEYLKRRKEILKATLPYKTVGQWDEP